MPVLAKAAATVLTVCAAVAAVALTLTLVLAPASAVPSAGSCASLIWDGCGSDRLPVQLAAGAAAARDPGLIWD